MAERVERIQSVEDPIEQTISLLRERRTTSPPEVRRMLAVQPSMHIGGLLVGTMNFLNYKARLLMWLGYWDMLNALEKGTFEFKWWRPVMKIDLGKGCLLCGARKIKGE